MKSLNKSHLSNNPSHVPKFISASPNDWNTSQSDSTGKLLIFFLLVYVAEGVGQAGGLIAQPLTNYLKTSLGWSASRVTNYTAILVLPWSVKFIYGLISDVFPLLGYRRKSYLFLANGLAVAAFLWLFKITAPDQIIVALFLTCIGMAASSTLCGAIMVEKGKNNGQIGKFVGQQWLWFSIASVVTSLVGGCLCKFFSPGSAFSIAALICALAPIGVMLGVFTLIEEEKVAGSTEHFKAAGRGLINAFTSKTLGIVALFLVLWNFSPGFGTPLYYHMVNVLHFDPGYVGVLGAAGSTGAVLGSLIYRYWLHPRMTLRNLLWLSVFMGTISQAAYVLLYGPVSAFILSFATAVATQIALLTLLTLAGKACPDRSEGFSYAVLMSLFNLAGQASAIVGGKLYDDVFGKQLTPLIWVSAAFTALCFFLVPLLPRFENSPTSAN